MAPKQHAARLPQAVAGPTSNGQSTNLGAFEVPPYDQPDNPMAGADATRSSQQQVATPAAATPMPEANDQTNARHHCCSPIWR